jgi:hypothetical protein
MCISEIEINNIKGISSKSFKVQLLPYKPNLLVAPNGFGKSSIATAFASMNTKRIDLAQKDHYKEDTSLLPELIVTVDGQKLIANNNKNEIRQKFDVLVINSGLIPKAKKHFKGAVSSDLEVRPITICKIPEKSEFIYKVGDIRTAFGKNGKILPNISELLKCTSLVNALVHLDLSTFTQKRIQSAVKKIIERINLQKGNSDDIKQWIQDHCINDLRKIAFLDYLSKHLVHLNIVKSEIEGFLFAYQIASLHSIDSKVFNAALEWLKYIAIKTHYDELLTSFKSSSWQWAKVEESKEKKTLFITFPMAHQLSNGQRDIITLVVHLHKTLWAVSGNPLILIIDEVFDYLDDANLVAFQYYVTTIIDVYRMRSRIIYPVILTHLDPGVFFDFCFNKHKIQINYLQAASAGKSQDTQKLIAARDTQDQIKNRLEKHWFHFHIDDCEIPMHEWPNTLPNDWRSSSSFHDHTKSELKRYLDGKNYDPLAVCFAVRVAVEWKCYDLLPRADQKEEFLNNVRKTNNKMDFVAGAGIDIPEGYFLLGLIYNTNLHWNQGRDYVSPLASKLNHPIIKQLISNI